MEQVPNFVLRYYTLVYQINEWLQFEFTINMEFYIDCTTNHIVKYYDVLFGSQFFWKSFNLYYL